MTEIPSHLDNALTTREALTEQAIASEDYVNTIIDIIILLFKLISFGVPHIITLYAECCRGSWWMCHLMFSHCLTFFRKFMVIKHFLSFFFFLFWEEGKWVIMHLLACLIYYQMIFIVQKSVEVRELSRNVKHFFSCVFQSRTCIFFNFHLYQ